MTDREEGKVYVAGHRGLVGSAVVKALKEKGRDGIITRPRAGLDLTRQAEVEAFLEENRPREVYLAAAKVGGILANNTYKAEFIYDNLMIAANVIHASYRSGVKKLLNLGSSCIYPKFAPQPITEDALLTGPLEPTNEPYAVAKISAIKLCRYYNEQYGCDFISVMPTNLYGPGDNFNLETSHVLPALIRKFHIARLLDEGDMDSLALDLRANPLGFGVSPEAVSGGIDASLAQAFDKLGVSGDSVRLWGTGEPFREFLHVDDMAAACVFIMENCTAGDVGEFVNIGTGTDIRIKDLAAIVRDVVGFGGEILFDATKPDGTPRKLLDVARVKALGWEPAIGLADGIRDTYGWYLESTGQAGATTAP